QWVHTSLLEGMLSKLDFQGARYTMQGIVPEPQGNDHPTIFPMGTFRCSNGFVNIAAPSDKMWNAFLDAIQDSELRKIEAYRTVGGRIKNKEELRRDIQNSLSEFTVEHLVECVNAAGVPCGPVNDIREGFENPQAKHLRMRKSVSHKRLGNIDVIRSPIQMSENPDTSDLNRAAPDVGEHSREVLSEFGFASSEIDGLIATGAVFG
ncbi:MAG: CoA transferase, partial [Gammaproteobacteria bacterium]|nr:CoA transferase [Gammaproteobacteria bacterium]